MYNDYPTVYETMFDQTIIYLSIIGGITLVISIVLLISMFKIYKKANRSGISAIIPIYNTIVLLEIVNLPKWYIILTFIPVLNIIIHIKTMLLLAKLFKKSKAFGIGLVLLPVVFYPILAFDGSEYIGINIVAMEGKSEVVNIPQISKDEDKNPVIHEAVDEKSSQINISIGGGIYQKDYTQDLLGVDAKQTIFNDKSNINTNNKPDPTNFSFITHVQPPAPKKEEPKPLGIDFPDKLNDNQNTNNMQINNSMTMSDYTNQQVNTQQMQSPLNTNIVNNNPTQPTNNLIMPNYINQPQSNQQPQNNQPLQNINTNQNIQTNENSIIQMANNIIPSSNKPMINPIIPNPNNEQPNNSQTGPNINNNQEIVTCPKCGAKLKGNSKVCFLCGNNLG